MKYKKGEFGYWWTVLKGNDDIEWEHVDGDINCHLKKLTSLKGAPKTINGRFDCSFNFLIDLKYSPESVNGTFDCEGNNLETLEGAPKTVQGDFNCVNNNLTSLNGLPSIIVGKSYFFKNANKHLEIEYEVRKTFPNYSESKIQNEMFRRTKDKSYLSKEGNSLFL